MTGRAPVQVAIIGAGLSGLSAAFLLERRGVCNTLVIEGRHAVGGRIMSVSPPEAADGVTEPAANRFDLGPSWFWPAYQPDLDALVRELGLQHFEQFESGDMMVERSPHAPAQRTRGYRSSPRSMRLLGGIAALTDALQRRLAATRIETGRAVRRLRVVDSQVEIEFTDDQGSVSNCRADRVLLALPPRLAEATIDFLPALPADLAAQWRATPTWMAPHAKYLAVYEQPFWREQGLSGEARSACGPLGEIHDATAPGGSAALFGFFGILASQRASVPGTVLREACRAQLARLFGTAAASPFADFIQDWAADPLTATANDQTPGGHVDQAPDATASSGPWAGRLIGIGSEWSPGFPGYLAGALEAASRGVQCLSDQV